MLGSESKDGMIEAIAQTSMSELIEETYLNTDNKAEIDYWTPLADVISESMELRQILGITQKQLADKMQTRQSVISRFENMGRVPTYDFIARMALAFGHAPGMTLYGDFMATVPAALQPLVKRLAQEQNKSTKKIVSELLETAIKRSGTIGEDYFSAAFQKPSIYSADAVMESSEIFGTNTDTCYSAQSIRKHKLMQAGC